VEAPRVPAASALIEIVVADIIAVVASAEQKVLQRKVQQYAFHWESAPCECAVENRLA
jgi:hypothetical protein